MGPWIPDSNRAPIGIPFGLISLENVTIYPQTVRAFIRGEFPVDLLEEIGV
jgi:hypothetical protein